MKILLVLLVLAGTAIADTDHVVLGPVAVDAAVSPDVVARVKAVVDRGNAVGARSIDANCIVDPTCLATAGAEAHAKLVVAVAVRGTGKDGIALELALIDVAAKELVGRRAITIADARLAAGLAPAIQKFLDEAPVERAKELFTKGNEHYSLGEFAKALEQYKQAYRVKPLPAFLFNIAQCHRKLNQHQEAIAMYQSYLVGVPDASNKQLVEDLIAESQRALADEQAAADRRATDDAKREADRQAAVKKAAEETRKAKEAEAAIVQARAEQARLEATLYDRHPARKWALVAGGVGVGAVIVGAAAGLATRSRQAAFDNAGCGDPGRLLSEAALAGCVDDRDRGKRDAMLANIFLFGGGAVVAAAAAVFVIDPGNLSRRETRVTIAPTSIQLMVRW